MMHNNGDNYYWGMHMGWWFFMIVVVIGLVVWFGRSRKRK